MILPRRVLAGDTGGAEGTAVSFARTTIGLFLLTIPGESTRGLSTPGRTTRGGTSLDVGGASIGVFPGLLLTAIPGNSGCVTDSTLSRFYKVYLIFGTSLLLQRAQHPKSTENIQKLKTAGTADSANNGAATEITTDALQYLQS